MDGHFQVTPERLSLAAGRLAELAARVESEGYAVRQSGAGLALATGNELASRAVSGAIGAWAATLQHLTAALHRDATALHEVAERYRAADREAERSVRQVLTGPGP
jgi:uncharacterized protein YukE